MALPNDAGMRAGPTISHLQWTGMSGVVPKPNFIITPSALLDDPAFFPEDQHWARQARQTKQDMKLIRPDETIPLIWPVTVAQYPLFITSALKLPLYMSVWVCRGLNLGS